jgi:DNA-binding transcriptional MerR regulator
VGDDARLTIDQLAVRTGMTVRNIRAHVTRGLLPPPQMQGRTAYYGAQHVARLQLITGLQQQGFNLAAISKLVSGPAAPSPQETVSFYRAALGPWLPEPPEVHDERELAAQFGLLPDPELVGRLQRLRLLEPMPGGRVRVLNPSILRAGRELAQLGFSTDQLVDVLRVLLRHSRAVADAFVEMFLETHWASYVEEGMPPGRLPELSRIIQALQPLAAQAVVAAFQQEMSAASSDAFDRTASTSQTDGRQPAAG